MMNMLETLSAQTPLHETSSEQMPVKMEFLPMWKQLIMESRQLQTVAKLLTVESKKQIATLKQGIVLERLLRRRLRDACL